ncbi:MAG: NarK/NasA family nitrate transporter [Deltaproteobacteria bacterium]|nr:NarK/NasA family nitrate transporter [Deltaproteobacteria bacterium]
MTGGRRSLIVLAATTFAFTACFAVWTLNGVLITFLVEQDVYAFSKSEMGWLIGIPVLSGSILRLPAGMLADRFGGRTILAGTMSIAALGMIIDSFATGFWSLLLGGLAFGVAGASFSVGIAYVALWFAPERQGTALGVFGMGNAGGALTAMLAPTLLRWLTDEGANLEGWRDLPRLYGGALLAATAIFWVLSQHRRVEETVVRTLRQRLAPLAVARVWRFGLYYFLVFGGFLALAQWLIPYYVSVYGVSVVVAGILSSIFTLPSGVIRALGGWLSDRFGARSVMYWVLSGTLLGCVMLFFPRMDIATPGEGVIADRAGKVTSVTPGAVVVGNREYPLVAPSGEGPRRDGTLIWPTSTFGQEPVVAVGDDVVKKQLIARGTTRIHFQANIWVFTGLVFLVGILMGVGKAAVYKHIPDYFPKDIGTVGGLVGVIGGLGGFVGPIVFGTLMDWTGLWTTTWMFLAIVSAICLLWMHLVVRRMTISRSPELARHFDEGLEVPLRLHCPVQGVPATVQLLVGSKEASARASSCSLWGSGSVSCAGSCVVGLKDERGVPK